MARRKYVKQKSFTTFGKSFIALMILILLLAFGVYWRNQQANLGQQAEMTSKEEKDAAEKLAFIKKIAPVVQQVNRQYGLFASVTIAQAALESDYGRSKLATDYYNLFGVKGSDPATTKLLETQEYVDGNWTTIKGRFRVYNSWRESINAHAILLTQGTTWNKNQYYDVVNARNATAAAKGLAKDGYATDPSYADKLLELIKKFNLTKFD